MTITLVRAGLDDVLPMQGRSPGLHVSDVIRDLMVSLGRWSPAERDLSPLTNPQAFTRMQLGCALEDAWTTRLQRADPHRYLHVGELSLDGLSGHPDLVDGIDQCPEECKFTWASTERRDDSPPDITAEKFIHYWWQVRAYGQMLRLTNGLDVRKVRLTVVFANGNNRGSGPLAFTWEAAVTHEGLDRNWKMLTDHAASMSST